MAGKSITIRALRERAEHQVPPRLGLRVVAVFVALQLLFLFALTVIFASPARAAPVKGELTVTASAGYVRLVFNLAEETEADVRLANGIVIIAFKNAIDVAVDHLATNSGGYIGAARRDPDGAGIRLALTRKVTVNSMAAGEKFFVDLLPEGWAGLPPGLPQEVVDDLARRAREADKRMRQQQKLAALKQQPPVRVRVGAQPTFTRYIFELPGLVPVATNRVEDGLTLTFDAPLRFDLADVQGALPPAVSAVEAMPNADPPAVRFAFLGKVDVRSFREDNNYVVDIQPIAQREVPISSPGKPTSLGTALIETRPAANAPTPAAPSVAAPPPAAPQATAPPPKPSTPPAEPAAPPAGVVASQMPVPQPATTSPPQVAAPVPPMSIEVELKRHGDTLRLAFPFAAPTPAAVFRRADTLWLVFDSAVPIDLGEVAAKSGGTIATATVARSNDGQVVQLKFDRAKLTSVGSEGPVWTVTIGDVALEPTRPLGTLRNMSGSARASVSIPFDRPSQLHRLADADIGDTLLVVTALSPARGFVKPQDFVEFRALASTHGVAIQPLADDVTAELSPERIIVTRPGGLVLSDAEGRAAAPLTPGAEPRRSERGALIDTQVWAADRAANFHERQTELIRAAADAPNAARAARRLDLSRYYLARGMYAEAKGVADLVANDERIVAEDGDPLVLRAIANIMLGRGPDAQKDLAQTIVGNRHDAPLWRAVAFAQQGKWVEAREGLKAFDNTIATLPAELQREVCRQALRAAIEVRDFNDAANKLHELETLAIPPDLMAEFDVLKGRVAEGIGRIGDALTFYRAASESAVRPAAATGKLREISLKHSIGEVKREDAVTSLEEFTAGWRGDETEAEALAMLARFYGEEGRYRDEFHLMKVALTAHPRSEMTRRIQDDAANTFEALFLTPKGDTLPAIDALSLFYDFRNLTPVGRRGDEMIRRLADRLVSMDLLDQAAELLQHQIDNRLQGAARAQVAVRLAVIYLMARKPDRAIQTLRLTRAGDLPTELRNQRLMIEARALSETGRADLALEVVANIEGREVERLRGDILWKARRWRQGAEQIEKMLGERWRDASPLTEPERADVLRGAIGYALAEETIGLDRFRQKYLPRVGDGADKRAFEIVTAPFAASAPEFAEIAKAIAAIDTLDAFLRDIKARFPEANAAVVPPAGPTGPAAKPNDRLVTGSAGRRF
jgi:tetratricopeptide (TPR) repeat protein